MERVFFRRHEVCQSCRSTESSGGAHGISRVYTTFLRDDCWTRSARTHRRRRSCLCIDSIPTSSSEWAFLLHGGCRNFLGCRRKDLVAGYLLRQFSVSEVAPLNS